MKSQTVVSYMRKAISGIFIRLNLFLKALKSIIFPYYCCLCQKYSYNELVCPQCWSKVIFINKPFCTICSKPLLNPILSDYQNDLICSECRENKKFFKKSISLALYQDEFKDIIHHFKFYNKPYLANFLGEKLFNLISLEADYQNIDVIIPVPLQKNRERQRGYNQSLLISNVIGKHLKLKVLKNNLKRKGNNPPQSNLSYKERKENIRNCFYIKDSQAIKDKKILLIDDVFTTGSTVNECARILRHAGAKEVLVATLARTA